MYKHTMVESGMLRCAEVGDQCRVQAVHLLLALCSAALKVVCGELAWEACEKLVHTL